MRTFELRIYTMRNHQALHLYAGTIYPRHLNSFSHFGVEPHGFWTAKDDVVPRLFVLVSYAEGDDPRQIEQRYLQSAELAEDIEGFDVGDIAKVESTILIPSAGSPLA